MEASTTFLFICFFLTIGSFILGGILAWNLKDIFDLWYANAGYAKHILHPEMLDDEGNIRTDELIYLRFIEDDDTILDEDD